MEQLTPRGISRRSLLAVGLSAPLVLSTRLAQGATTSTPRADALPVALPAVRHFTPGPAALRFTAATRIVIAEPMEEDERVATAELLAEELVSEGVLARSPEIVADVSARPMDIVLAVGPVAGTDCPEAYEIWSGRWVTVTGTTADGVFWGTRTLVQVLRSGHLSGTIRDWPLLDERGVMLDIGRKYFRPGWIKALIREMSFLKLNTLQLHLSEGTGFRIECESHPEIVSEQHLTKSEVREIMAVARRYHVAVNGDLDSPGHFEWVLAQHPQFQLHLADGQIKTGALDYSKPGAQQLVQELISEFIDLFDGPVFHIGGDEYLPAAWQIGQPGTITEESAPQLVEYAREVTGNPDATLNDSYEIYMNNLANLVRAKGKVARMWNDDIYPGEGVTQVGTQTQLDVWIRWRTWYPHAGDFVDAGYDVVNSNGDYLYFILAANGYQPGPKKSPEGVYELWTPRTFMGAAGGQADYLLPEDRPMLGSHISVWCDNASSMTEEEVAFYLQEWLQTFSQQTWGTPKPVPTVAELRTAVIDKVGTAPPPA